MTGVPHIDDDVTHVDDDVTWDKEPTPPTPPEDIVELIRNLKLPQMPRVLPLTKRGEWVQIWMKFFRDLVSLVFLNSAATFPIVAKTADYTTTKEDYTILIDGSLNAVTISLDASAVKGKTMNLKCIDATNTCKAGRNGNNIDATASDFTLFKDESITIQADENNDWWII